MALAETSLRTNGALVNRSPLQNQRPTKGPFDWASQPKSNKRGMGKRALVLAIALALSASPTFGWDDKECEDWLKTHPTPHPDCVQATPTPQSPTATPRPHHEETPTPVPQPTNTPQPQPTATQQPAVTPIPNTPTTVPTAGATATPTQLPASSECVPCGEADAPTPVVAAPIATSTPIVLAAVAEVAPVTEIPPARPVQVLSAGPTLLPFTGDAIPYVASLLLGFGLTIGGWLLRRGS